MELEIYRALVKINVSADDAQAVADSINKEIDKRYPLRSSPQNLIWQMQRLKSSSGP